MSHSRRFTVWCVCISTYLKQKKKREWKKCSFWSTESSATDTIILVSEAKTPTIWRQTERSALGVPKWSQVRRSHWGQAQHCLASVSRRELLYYLWQSMDPVLTFFLRNLHTLLAPCVWKDLVDIFRVLTRTAVTLTWLTEQAFLFGKWNTLAVLHVWKKPCYYIFRVHWCYSVYTLLTQSRAFSIKSNLELSYLVGSLTTMVEDAELRWKSRKPEDKWRSAAVILCKDSFFLDYTLVSDHQLQRVADSGEKESVVSF